MSKLKEARARYSNVNGRRFTETTGLILEYLEDMENNMAPLVGEPLPKVGETWQVNFTIEPKVVTKVVRCIYQNARGNKHRVDFDGEFESCIVPAEGRSNYVIKKISDAPKEIDLSIKELIKCISCIPRDLLPSKIYDAYMKLPKELR